jgi:glycosyltransferase involved in cell wall biosynthesis
MGAVPAQSEYPMTDAPATVSVIIPCFKHAQYLKQAVESVLAQTYPAVEIIVIDDGSPDNTAEVAASFGDRIIYHRQENAGLSAARNKGISLATGEHLLFLDADDLLQPFAISEAMELSATDVICTGWIDIDPQGRTLAKMNPAVLLPDPFHALLEKNIAPCHAFVVRKRAVDAVGAFDVELQSHEDWDLWLRLAAAGHHFELQPSQAAMYRRAADSMSGNAARMIQTSLAVLRKNATRHVNCELCRVSLDKAMNEVAKKYWIARANRQLLPEQRSSICENARSIDPEFDRRLRRVGFESALGLIRRGRLLSWLGRSRKRPELRTIRALAHPEMPSASVVITTKNRKDDLRRAIRSAVAQQPRIEVIVIDDGSTDGTIDAISAEFSRISIYRSDQSQGYIVHRNRAATLARAPIIFSIDDDAEFSTPQVVAQTLAEFDDPRVGAVAIPFEDMNTHKIVRAAAPDRSQIYVTDAFVGTAYAVRKDVFQQLGGFREVLFHQEEEREFCLRMLDRGFVTRVGSADVIHHYESPIRNWSRMTVYTARNRILYIWHNVPFPYLLAHLASTTANLVRYGARTKHLGWALRGIAMGYGAVSKELFNRKPVSRSTFELSRAILKRGAPPVVPLREIESELQ